MEDIKTDIITEVVNKVLEDEKVIQEFISFIINKCKYCDRIMVNDFMGLVFEFWSDKLPFTSTIMFKDENLNFRECVLNITNEINAKHLSLWTSIKSISETDSETKDWDKQYMVLDKKSFRKAKLGSFSSDEG